MNGCLIPHTPIAVDFWKIRECPQARIFFLTHLHGDHITGLTSSWRFPIYCSEITKQLLVHKFGIPESLVNVLEVGSTRIIHLDDNQNEQMSVTAIDAQHCPGAIMILMEGYFGTILHTGDFRYHPDMITGSTLSQYSGRVDILYLDNTYCTSSCRFPPRDDAIKQIIDIIEKHPSYDILIAMRNLGKEILLSEIAHHFHEWISVSGNFYETLQILGAPDVFDCTSTEHRIRVVPFYKVSNNFVQKVNEECPTIVIIPTALYCGIDATPYENNKHVFVVPYSDHSSYSEILEFVSFLKPGRIIPIVEAKARGPFGCSIANRADMSQFAKFTRGGCGDSVVIPASVQAFMNHGHSHLPATRTMTGMKRKKPLHQKVNRKKERKGVSYESPDSKHATIDCVHDKNQVIVDSTVSDVEKENEFSEENLQDPFDNQFPHIQLTFDKALGRKTYSRSLVKKKLGKNNATQEPEDDQYAAKHARCLEFVNSLGPDFDVIEEEEIVWKDAPRPAKKRRVRKNKQKIEKNNDMPHKISGDIDDEISNTISRKKKGVKQKCKLNISGSNAKDTKDILGHGGNLTLNYKAVNMNEYETIVLSDSNDPTENDKNFTTDLKVNGQYSGPYKHHIIAEKYFADETKSDNSGQLVIDLDFEQVSVNVQSVVPEIEKQAHKITENINKVENVKISIVNDTPDKSVVSKSMNELGNEGMNDSIDVQVGTQCPGHTDVEGSDGADLNDSMANIRQDEKDVKASCKQDNESVRNRHNDNACGTNSNTNASGIRDEPHAQNDDSSNCSVDVNIGTQVVNETIELSFVEELETCEDKILIESVHEQSISVINDSTEAITGTQAFINQTFDEENEIGNNDTTNSDTAYVENNMDTSMKQSNVVRHCNDKTSKGKAHFDALNDQPAVNDKKQEYRTKSRQRTLSSSQICLSDKSRFLLGTRESDDKEAKESEISLNMSSLKFKPLNDIKTTDSKKYSRNELSFPTQDIDISENHTPQVDDSLILNECTNKAKSIKEFSKFKADRLDELGAFIKTFEYFENINAQKKMDGRLKREEMLKAKAYKRYLAGLESDELKNYPKCSFRVKPFNKNING